MWSWYFSDSYVYTIAFISLFLYAVVPCLAVYLIGRFVGRRFTFLAPVVSLVVLGYSAALLLYLLESADLGRIFNPLYQLIASAIILALYWLFQLRERLSAKPSVRWSLTAALGLIAGAATCIILMMWSFLFLAGFTFNDIHIPHLRAAFKILPILFVIAYVAALFVTRALHPKDKPLQRNVLSLVVFIVASAVGFTLLSLLDDQLSPLITFLLWGR